MIFHSHRWEESERFYAPPRHPINVKNIDVELMNRLVFGVTTIIYKCHCGDIRTEEILGASTKTEI